MDIKIINDDLKFKVRVSGIIINNNRVLVDEYGDNLYCLPGGYVNIGETTEKAVIRELFEETGIDFDIVKFGGVIENFFTNYKNQKTHGIDFYYYVKIKNNLEYDNLNLNYAEEETNGIIQHNYHWISINDIDKYNLVPTEIKNIIKENIDSFHIIIDR